MSQRRTQQLDTLIPELTGGEVQKLQGLVESEGQGELIPLWKDVGTRPQPVGYMGATRSLRSTEKMIINLVRFPKDCILELHDVLLQYVCHLGLNYWRPLTSFASSRSPWPFYQHPASSQICNMILCEISTLFFIF